MNKALKYSLIALPILVGGYFIYKKLYPKKQDAPLPPPPPTPTPTPTPTGGGSPINVRSEFPLKKGSRGTLVKKLQGYILKKDPKALPRFGADSSFGNETEAALQSLFQKTSVNSQAELDEIAAKSLPTYKKGDPLVYKYGLPTFQVSPFLNLTK